jgi:excisionase family DNA binding protein
LYALYVFSSLYALYPFFAVLCLRPFERKLSMTQFAQSQSKTVDSDFQTALNQSKSVSDYPNRWLTLTEAATALRCSPRTLFRRMAEGRLRSQFLGRHHRFLVSDLENLLSNRTQNAATKQAEACAPA